MLKTIKLGPLTPSQLADLEIKRLSNDPETTCIVVLGGSLTSEQLQENVRRSALLQQKVVGIIVKHGVQAEHIAPRLAMIQRLEKELKEHQSWIDALT